MLKKKEERYKKVEVYLDAALCAVFGPLGCKSVIRWECLMCSSRHIHHFFYCGSEDPNLLSLILVVPLISPAGPQSGSQQLSSAGSQQSPPGPAFPAFIHTSCQTPVKTLTSLSLLRRSHACTITLNSQKAGKVLRQSLQMHSLTPAPRFTGTAHIAVPQLKLSLPTLAAWKCPQL